MQGGDFDELQFFKAVAMSNCRALLIGRRELVALGLPVLTADYDYWIHIDDIARFNEAALPFSLTPTHSPQEARRRGRYALENDEHIDVMVARSVPTVDGVVVAFDDVWSRRRGVSLSPDVAVALPSHADLISTKRFVARAKDIEDIRLLEILASKDHQP